MKKLIFSIFVCFCSIAYAVPNDPIRIDGQGPTRTEALKDAFTRAIEIYSGTAILSSKELKNDKLKKNEIHTYSAGYVDRYQVVDVIQAKNYVTVIVDVWVQASYMASHRNKFDTSDKDIDGETLSARLQSFENERNQLDSFISNILADYPSKGLVLETETPTIFIDGSRTPTISINALIYWDNNFLKSFREVMLLVQDKKQRSGETVVILYQENPTDFFWSSDKFYLQDVKLLNSIKKTITAPVGIITKIYDENNNVLHSKCSNVGTHFISQNQNILTIGGKTKKYSLTINVDILPNSKLYKNADKVDRVELKLVNSCSSRT